MEHCAIGSTVAHRPTTTGCMQANFSSAASWHIDKIAWHARVEISRMQEKNFQRKQGQMGSVSHTYLGLALACDLGTVFFALLGDWQQARQHAKGILSVDEGHRRAALGIWKCEGVSVGPDTVGSADDFSAEHCNACD